MVILFFQYLQEQHQQQQQQQEQQQQCHKEVKYTVTQFPQSKKKTFVRPSSPQFALKIRGGGPLGPSPESATEKDKNARETPEKRQRIRKTSRKYRAKKLVKQRK